MKHKLLHILKGFGIISAILLLVAFLIYTAAWFAMTKRTQTYINAVWNHADFKIEGTKPQLTGYPLEPTAHFAGVFEHKSGFKLTTPQLNYAGFSAPHQLQYLEAPEGIFITAPFLDQNIKIDYAMIKIRVPRHFPSSLRKDDITAWQESDDPFVIPHLVLNTGKISATGSGTMTLDKNLQLNGEIDARIMGMDALLDEIASGQGQKTITMAKGFLNMMTEVDPTTGDKYFQTKIRIQNNSIFVGPLRITGLPQLTWTP